MEVSPLNISFSLIPVTTPVVTAVKEVDTENKTDSDTEAGEQGEPGQQDSRLQSGSIQQLSQEERAEVQQLQQRDREVRTHEAAHKSAAGRFAQGGASFEYQRGPDGQQYAVGGEVSIDTSRPEDPRQALIKAQIIQRAATAPAQPSAQDRAVASEAANMIAEAQIAIQQQRQEAAEKEPAGVQDAENDNPDPTQTEGASEPIETYTQVQQLQQTASSDPVYLIA